MRTETLIVEDLMLLLMDDESGTPAQAGTLHYALGGAVLVELALLDRITTEGTRSGMSGPKVVTSGDGPLPDPLLQSAHDRIAERTRAVQSLLLDIGGGLYKEVIDRLLDRGLIRRERKKVLGLFRVDTLPSDDARHEAEIRARIRAALEDGETPDARTAALIALLSASGALPALRPALAWSGPVAKRAKEFESGNWGAAAVNTAVSRTAAAIAASTAAVSITAITTVT